LNFGHFSNVENLLGPLNNSLTFPRLDGLVRHLTVAEIRRLRIQLNAVTIPNDICVEFPTELLSCIAEHLDLEEVIRARAVSRTWNRAFSSADFCIGIIKTHFRPVWEKRYKRLSAGQQNVQKEVLRQWLSRAAKDRIRRQHGRYRSTSICQQVDYDINDWQYKNGRIAFRRDSSAFIVKDLRTGSIVTYLDENRVALGTWLLSDDFLIAVKNGP
jgi:F-box domain